jgi:iron complex outermembrane receptor protein
MRDWPWCRCLVSVLALGTSSPSHAQVDSGTLSGEVLDGAAGRPLAGAQVTATSSALQSPRTVVTDGAGRFVLGALPPGDYRLEARAEGYLPEARADLKVRANGTVLASLAVTPEAVQFEEVVVTGSHIQRKDLVSPAPLTIVTREEILASGKVLVADFIQALPVQANSMNANYNNGGDGAIRASLRGLGEWRTLVLVNGRRFVAGGTGANDSVDLGSIPSAAVERIEILKDGASPIYGSEAIGGVINVITRKNWVGTEVTAYAGTSAHGDGTTYAFSLTTGRASEAGSLLLSVGYGVQQPVWAGNRDWSRYAWNYDATGENSPLGVVGPYAVGSGSTPAGRAWTVDNPGQTVPNPTGDSRIDLYNQLVTQNPTATSFTPDAAAPLGWRPWRGGALPQYGGDQYNYQPDNYLVTPSQRFSIFATGDVRLGARTRGFIELSYLNRESQQKIAPEPLSLGPNLIILSASNPFNPFGLDLDHASGRFMALGNRRFTQSVDTLRVLAGFDGSLPDALGPLEGWRWEASAAFGRTQAVDVKRGYTRNSMLRNALGPAFDANQGTGKPPDWRCGTDADNEIEGCVPFNMFGTGAALTQAQVDYVTFDGTARGTNQLASLLATVSGDLFRLLSPRPVGVAVGYEYRKVGGTYTPDPITASGDASTDGTATKTEGSQYVNEAFVELSLPIAEGLPFLEVLEAQLAARVFRYSGFGSDWTWKVGARWKPVQDVTIRGTLSTAFRAPSISELYFGAHSNRLYTYDPCAGVDDLGLPEPISPWCGPAANNGQQNVVATHSGHGNTALRPEVATVYTAGLVLEPRFLRNLSIAVDLYGVSINQVIQWNGDTVSLCYPMETSTAPIFCEFVQRDPTTQALSGVLYTPVNYGSERMAGLDVSVRYALPTSAGRFGFSLDATWLQRYDLTRVDGSVLKVKGNYDLPAIGALYPAWKFNAAATWNLGPLGAGLDVRYIGSFKECAGADGNFPGTECSFEHAYERTISEYASWNAQVGYGLLSAAGKTDLIVGVQNLLDTRPPTIYWSAYGSDPGYDFVGRYFYLRLAHRL